MGATLLSCPYTSNGNAKVASWGKMKHHNGDFDKSNAHQQQEDLARLQRIACGLAKKEDLEWYNTWCNALQQDARITNPEEQISNFSSTQSDIFAKINQQIDHKPLIRKVNIPRLAAAAAIVVTLSAGLFFYMNKPDVSNNIVTLKGADITPGRSSATLTLADGRKILLAATVNGQLAKESGVTITKNADGELIYEISDQSGLPGRNQSYNTLSTMKGEQYQVRLPDGSRVWLNAASSLRYPTTFSAQQRRQVDLNGEAYFEVAKDKNHPFIVNAKGQQVEVLGTHFNINGYKDEALTKTTLLEGSVRVNGKTTIRPGEQATGDAYHMKVTKADVDAATDWTNGDFIFNESDDFKSAMRKVARWYDVDIIYDAEANTDMELRGWISRKNKLSVVLQRIASTGKVHFKIEGRRVTVTR